MKITTLAEAEERRQQLTLEVQGIQAQLGDRQRTDESGRRLTSNEYWAWKKKAQYALNQKLDELRSIKNWIRDLKAPAEEGLARHVEDLCQMCDTLKSEGVDFDAAEWSKVESARAALSRLRGSTH